MNASLTFHRVTCRDKTHFDDYLRLSRFTVHGRQKPPTPEALHRILTPDGYEAQITYEGRRPVSLIEYYYENRDGKKVLTLDAVATDPQFQKRGLALASCLRFLDFARETGIGFCRFAYLNAPMCQLALRLMKEPRYFDGDSPRKQELFKIYRSNASEFFDLLIKIRPPVICKPEFQHTPQHRA